MLLQGMIRKRKSEPDTTAQDLEEDELFQLIQPVLAFQDTVGLICVGAPCDEYDYEAEHIAKLIRQDQFDAEHVQAIFKAWLGKPITESAVEFILTEVNKRMNRLLSFINQPYYYVKAPGNEPLFPNREEDEV